MEHTIKEQTKKHVKKMKSMLVEVIDCGFTKEEVIDLGDYVLDQMTIAELTGAADETKTKDKKSTKKADKPVAEPEAEEETAEEPKKKGKGKKGKGKKAK